MPAPQPAARAQPFPPEPWRLEGELTLAAWLAPAAELDCAPPPGWRPVGLFGRRLVGAVLARYGPGGDLVYRELALGVAVRRGLRLAVTIPRIWVDDAAALEGGRRLWAIPKQPAAFRRVGEALEADDASGRALAQVRARPLLPLPGRWPVRFRIAQPGPDGPCLTPARIAGRVALARSGWRAFGPLALLGRRPPLVSLRVDRARLVFGRATPRRRAPPKV